MNEKLKKGIEIALNVLLYAVLVIALFSVIMAIVSKKDPDGAATVFGHQIRIVQSESMEKSEHTDVSGYKIKSLPLKALLVVQVVPTDEEKAEEWYANIKKGDVLTFRYVYDRQVTITHRVCEEPEKKETGGYIIRLAGDNKDSGDPAAQDIQVIDTSLSTSPNYIIGKVVSSSPLMGNFIYILKQPVGIVCVVIIPALIIIIWEVVRIVNVLNEEKRKKALDESKQKEDEIEALKKQLALLSQAVGVKTDGEAAPAEETPEEQE